MKLSIIIPLYNKEKYIERCLESLLIQGLSPDEYEILVIDDGSKDSGGAIVQGYSEKHGNVHLFSQQNKGVSATRNRGLDLAKGEYVYFLDADDYLAHNVLNRLLKWSKSNELEILTFNTTYTEDSGLTASSTQNPQDLTIDVIDGFTFIAERSYRNEAWWYIIKRSFLIHTGIRFIEGRFMEDALFTSNLFLMAKRTAKSNLDVHRFVKVQNSIQTSTDSAHLQEFIHDLVFAIEEIDDMITDMDSSHKKYPKAVRDFKRKQQSFVFTLLIKVFRCPILSFRDLKKILARLNKLGVYPIDRKIGGIGNHRTSRKYNMIVIPVLNNRPLLFLALGIKRLFPVV